MESLSPNAEVCFSVWEIAEFVRCGVFNVRCGQDFVPCLVINAHSFVLAGGVEHGLFYFLIATDIVITLSRLKSLLYVHI